MTLSFITQKIAEFRILHFKVLLLVCRILLYRKLRSCDDPLTMHNQLSNSQINSFVFRGEKNISEYCATGAICYSVAELTLQSWMRRRKGQCGFRFSHSDFICFQISKINRENVQKFSKSRNRSPNPVYPIVTTTVTAVGP